MIASMTAFARAETTGEWGAAVWELRTVNFRYLDISVRLPEDLRALDPGVRESVGARLARGKVDCTLRYHRAGTAAQSLRINTALVNQLVHASNEVESLIGEHKPLQPIDVLRWPGVIEPAPLDVDSASGAVMAALDSALGDIVETRRREGEKILGMLEQRYIEVEQVTRRVREWLPEVQRGARDRLAARLGEIKENLDTDRLEQEMVIFASKTDVAEELDRLDAHCQELRHVLASDKPAGRRLDFLMQEMNREANTLGSKSADNATTRASVDLKVLIEQMREQIQNVE